MSDQIEPVRQAIDTRYGEFYRRNARLRLDAARVAEKLRPLIPLAELWGITDDGERGELIESAPRAAFEHLVEIEMPLDDELEAWLLDHSGVGESQTEEFFALSMLWRVAIYAQGLVKDKGNA